MTDTPSAIVLGPVHLSLIQKTEAKIKAILKGVEPWTEQEINETILHLEGTIAALRAMVEKAKV